MVFEKLKSIISEQLTVPEGDIDHDTSFQDDLNADSLDIFQLIMAIEEEFEMEISNEDAENITTVGSVVEFITNANDLD